MSAGPIAAFEQTSAPPGSRPLCYLSLPPPHHPACRHLLCAWTGAGGKLSKNGKFSHMISFEVLLRCTEGHKHLIHSLMGSYVCPHPWGGFPRSIYGPLPACRKAPSVPLQVTTLPTFLTWRSLSCFGTLHKWHHCSLASFTQLSA